MKSVTNKEEIKNILIETCNYDESSATEAMDRMAILEKERGFVTNYVFEYNDIFNWFVLIFANGNTHRFNY